MDDRTERTHADDAIFLEHATFAYTAGAPVLDVRHLHIARGEQVFLYGPSGSGKTTLLSLIAGIHRASSGTVRVLGRDLLALSAGARDRLRGERMGYIFQGFNLIPYLSVADNIALPCRLYPDRLRRIRAATLPAEVARLAQRLDIAGKMQEPVRRLSVGQQQRVAIARALIGSPELVIADEPTSSLDTERRDSFLALLQSVMAEAEAAPATLLFVSHDRSLQNHFHRTLSLPDLNGAAVAAA